MRLFGHRIWVRCALTLALTLSFGTGGGAEAAPPPPPTYNVYAPVLPGSNSAVMDGNPKTPEPDPIPEGAEVAWLHVYVYGAGGWSVRDAHIDDETLVSGWQQVSLTHFKVYYDGMYPGQSFSLTIKGHLTRPGPVHAPPPEFWLNVHGTLASPPYYVLPPEATRAVKDPAVFSAYYEGNLQKSKWSSRLENGDWQNAGAGETKSFKENTYGWYEVKAEHVSEDYRDTARLCFVALEQLYDSWDESHAITITEPAYVTRGQSHVFHVTRMPSDAPWPKDKPVWTATGDGRVLHTNKPEQVYITFPKAGEDEGDAEWVEAECGNTLQGKVIVLGCDFDGNLGPEYATWVANGHHGNFAIKVKLRPMGLKGELLLTLRQGQGNYWLKVFRQYQVQDDVVLSWDGTFETGESAFWNYPLQARAEWTIRDADNAPLGYASDEETLLPAFLDLDIDTNGDGDVTDDDGAGEASPGAFLPVKDPSATTLDPKDLRKLVIQKVVPDGFGGELKLMFQSGVAIYGKPDRTEPVLSQQTIFHQSDLPATLYVEGREPGVATITLLTGALSGVSVTANVVQVDLDVDSDNNGSVTDADDTIEDAASGTGKIVLANTLDSTANDVPDFADGIDRNGNSGSGRATGFVSCTLTIPSPVDLSVAKLKVTYSAADPAAVTAAGDPVVYTAGSAGNLRLWTKNGPADRKAAGINAATPGDFIPPGEYPARKIIKTGTTVTLYIEGINRSDPQNTRILVELDPTGTAGFIAKDAVRCTVATLDLDFRDITGIDWPSGPSVNTPRVPTDSEVDGVACDRLKDVDDGTAILVRAIGSPALYSATSPPVTVSFGYVKKDASPVVFAALPGGTRREGRFKELSPDDEAFLATLPLEKKGDVVGDLVAPGHRVVIAAMKYEPPYELDVADISNKQKERRLPLALDVTGKVTGHGSRPHRITLVRPPLVLVHGINASYRETYLDSGWTAKFEDDFGFVCEGADHSNIPAGFYGNGDIHEAYTAVRNASSTATHAMRDGVSFANKFVACQKCDIVASSYGGLLSRWYTEQSDEYKTRRNVRKIITMGTPHRGALVCNMMAATYKRKLFYDAETGGDTPTPSWSLGELLEHLDNGIVTLKIRWHEGANGPDPTGDSRIVPSLQVMSFPSAVLDQKLNRPTGDRPFRDDIAYGSIIGTHPALVKGLWGDAHVLIEPHYEDAAMRASYFPWFSGLDATGADSDGVVPIWSQTLPAQQRGFAVNHIGYAENDDVREQVRQWLNNPTLARGGEHRAHFPNALDPQGDASRRQAYVGSHLDNGDSRGADVWEDAIVCVKEVTVSHPEADFHVDPKTNAYSLGPKGGLVTFVCTGMVSDADRRLSIRTSWGTKLQESIPIPFSGTPGVLNRFIVYADRIGRTMKGDIIGPNGQANNSFGSGDVDWSMVYKVTGNAYAGWTELGSAPKSIKFSEYVLPPPEGISPVPPAPGNPFTVSGGVPCTVPGGGTQEVDVELIDWDSSGDNTLVNDSVNTVAPSMAFPGVLIPYSGQFWLFKDTDGNVAGDAGTSGERSADVYQQLVLPGGIDYKKSERVKVRAAP